MNNEGRPVVPSPYEVMGIVNLTPDSFWQGSRTFKENGKLDEGVLRAVVESHIEGGATCLDVGACSTRPGSTPVSPEEEARRLEAGLPIVASYGLPISVDTFRSSVVTRCLDIVEDLTINDIHSGEDPWMLELASEGGLPFIAMHGADGRNTDYSSYEQRARERGISPIAEAVIEYFKDFEQKAWEMDVEWILDPGFGFGKTLSQNYDLLRDLDMVSQEFPGVRMLVGVSRKSMIFRKFGITPADCLPQTQVLHLLSLQKGASILRVHDCAEAARTISTYLEMQYPQFLD